MHHRYRQGDYETWKYIAPIQRGAWQHRTFESGTWGGEFQLKKHGLHQPIVIGLIAHTCIEATVRYAAEPGYDVTVVRDATADYSDEMMHAALDANMPNYASAVVNTEEVVDSISTL
jgi:ureidoacrylate peracid hydrolase